MPLIAHKITAFLKKVVDLTDVPSENMSPADIKAWFDSSPEELRVKHNDLVDDLVANTGALEIGAKNEAGVTTTVQAQLDKLGIEDKTRYLDAVATVALRDSTYPTPTHGDTVRVTTPEEGLARTYRYVNGSGWVVTDVYNPTAIDEVTSQLADTGKSVGVMISQFPRIALEVVDNPRIQRALNSMTNGGMLVLSNEEYLFNGATVTIPGNNISIIGHGKSTKLKLQDSVSVGFVNRAWFYASLKDGITIENVMFDGGTQSTTYDMLSLSQCSNVKVDKIHFENAYGSSMNFSQTTDYTISNITLKEIKGATGNPGEGLYAIGSKRGTLTNLIGYNIDDHLVYLDGSTATPTEDITISNAIAVNCGRAAGGSAFNIFKKCMRVTFNSCHSYQSGVGFIALAFSNESPSDITYNGCSAHNSDGAVSSNGFSASGLAGGSDMMLKFIGCTAANNGNGVTGTVGVGFTFVDVNDISLSNCDSIKSNDDGLRLNKCKRVTVNGGKYINNGLRGATPIFMGIRVGNGSGTMAEGASDDIHISNVRTYDNLATRKQNYGVYFETGSTNCSLVGGKHSGNVTGAWTKTATVEIHTNVNKDGTLGHETSISAAPDFVGQEALVSGIFYKAIATGAATDWKQIS